MTPYGRIVNPPAELSKQVCRYIVNAINKKKRTQTDRLPEYPLPWSIKFVPDGRGNLYPAMWSENAPEREFVNEDRQYIGSINTCTYPDMVLIVETVNEWYGS